MQIASTSPSAPRRLYLDSSAIVKLIVREPETAALRRHVREARLFANEIVLAEVPRAIRAQAAHTDLGPLDRGLLAVLATLNLTQLTRRVLLAAGTIELPRLRTLDAIHIAAAARLGAGIDAFVSYDRRQAQAAGRTGLHVESPA